MKLGHNIVFFDIETSPNVVYSWNVGPKVHLSPDCIVEERRIICICWKHADEKKVHSLTWDPKTQCDKKMLKDFVKAIHDCDLLIGHNGDSFDVKWLKTRLIFHRLPPLENMMTADTLKFSRANFRFNSNRLDYLGEYLGVGRKVATGGFQLWKDVMAGSKKAMNNMVKYCKQDVKLLENVFIELLPHVKTAPFNMSMLLRKDREGCIRCGSSTVHKWGTHVAKSLVYQKYKCQGCGHVFKSTKSMKVEK